MTQVRWSEAVWPMECVVWPMECAVWPMECAAAARGGE